MNQNLQRFLGNFYYIDVVNDAEMARASRVFIESDAYKKHAAGIKTAFGKLLRYRSLSVDDYERLTNVTFKDAEALYTYLQGVYNFLFEGALHAPVPLGLSDHDSSAEDR